jgi:hypothetical protein
MKVAQAWRTAGLALHQPLFTALTNHRKTALSRALNASNEKSISTSRTPTIYIGSACAGFAGQPKMLLYRYAAIARARHLWARSLSRRAAL